MKVAGVYSIRSPSGNRYIGSSVGVASRWRQHRYALKCGKHVNAAAGKTLTEEHKRKIGQSNRGRSPSRAAIEKGAAARRGIKQSDETKAKRLASYLATVVARSKRAAPEL